MSSCAHRNLIYSYYFFMHLILSHYSIKLGHIEHWLIMFHVHVHCNIAMCVNGTALLIAILFCI